jgi:uncharacterized repeat protein (TIGR03803 family)
MPEKRLHIRLRATLAVLIVSLLVTETSAAAHETVLHHFQSKDGANPSAGLIFDGFGNLYGTTENGGSYGYGTVFELTPMAAGGWTEKVLHDFNADGVDGAYPYYGSLIFDGSGNLYGTTAEGGSLNSCQVDNGCGTVFELTPTANGGWTETVIHSFNNNGTDGFAPTAGLIFDTIGNLYGMTDGGGTYYGGTVFEMTPTSGGTWTETVLHSFNNNGTDGYGPSGGLIFDPSGNLYGATYYGGTGSCNDLGNGCGTVFELTPATGGSWTERVLYNFERRMGGVHPEAGLIFDASGNLYDMTRFGGSGGCINGFDRGCGTVFELTHTADGWKEKVLHNFNNNGKDGDTSDASLMSDASGNLYGTTFAGGAYNSGTVFELMPSTGGGWTEVVLHSFGDGKDGGYPDAGLIRDASGNLYGTTSLGGAYNYGTVFEITP